MHSIGRDTASLRRVASHKSCRAECRPGWGAQGGPCSRPAPPRPARSLPHPARPGKEDERPAQARPGQASRRPRERPGRGAPSGGTLLGHPGSGICGSGAGLWLHCRDATRPAPPFKLASWGTWGTHRSPCCDACSEAAAPHGPQESLVFTILTKKKQQQHNYNVFPYVLTQLCRRIPE